MSAIRGTYRTEPFIARKVVSSNGDFLEVVIRGHPFRAGRIEGQVTRRDAKAAAARWLRENELRWRAPNVFRGRA